MKKRVFREKYYNLKVDEAQKEEKVNTKLYKKSEEKPKKKKGE
jgi:hypothetical protein